MGVILRGATGAGVRELQRKLIALGYLSPEAAASGPGVFGPRTEEAVRAFQKRHGLKMTGVVGTFTQAALTAALERVAAAGLPGAAPSPPPASSSVAPQLPAPAVTSGLGDRSASRYSAVIGQFAVETNPRYAAHGPQTFAHVFVNDVTSAMGAEVPRRMGDISLNVNGVCGWLGSMGNQQGWRAVDAAGAQAAANAGQPTVAAWRNPAGTGHVAIVRPGTMGSFGPAIAQAGARNFTQGFVEHGFGAARPGYWVHA
jgi:hypothetical protein